MTKFTANAKRFVHYYQKMSYASNSLKGPEKLKDFYDKIITKYRRLITLTSHF